VFRDAGAQPSRQAWGETRRFRSDHGSAGRLSRLVGNGKLETGLKNHDLKSLVVEDSATRAEFAVRSSPIGLEAYTSAPRGAVFDENVSYVIFRMSFNLVEFAVPD